MGDSDFFGGHGGFLVRPASVGATGIDIFDPPLRFTGQTERRLAGSIRSLGVYYGLGQVEPDGRRSVCFSRQNFHHQLGIRRNAQQLYPSFPEVGILPVAAALTFNNWPDIVLSIDAEARLDLDALAPFYNVASLPGSAVASWLEPLRCIFAGAGADAAAREHVIRLVRLADRFQAIYHRHRVLLHDAQGQFDARDLGSIDHVLAELPRGVVEWVHTLSMHEGLGAGEWGTAGNTGTIELSIHDVADAPPMRLDFRDGTASRGVRPFQAILLHEIGHIVDGTSVEHTRYTELFNRAPADPAAFLGGVISDRAEDFINLWNGYLFDSEAVLAFVARQRHPVLGGKLAHVLDHLAVEEAGRAPIYRADEAHQFRRVGSLPVRRGAPRSLGDDGPILQVGDHVLLDG